MDYKNTCKKEVVDMHRFFTEWYTAVLPENRENFARFHTVMNEKVGFVGTNGGVISKSELIGWIKDAYGSHEKGAFEIEIKNFQYLAGHGDLHVLGYEEWQYIGDDQIILETTTVLKDIQNHYNQLEWSRIHVTEKK